MIKFLIAGDLCPKDRVADLIENSDFETVFSDVKQIFEKSDYSILNLEAPIVDDGNVLPIEKSGPALKCTRKVIDSLKFLGANCVTLANNHFRDYGDSGALLTMRLCKEASIDYVGAGTNIENAALTLFTNVNGHRVAIINCCEHEYSIAGKNRAGSNPLIPVKQYYAIKDAKDRADHVIVIVHGGIEHYQLPAPRMAETYRFFIDAGADTVINHHQHCFSGYEVYNRKPIFYGLGNFCFDWNGKRDSMWNEGYMVSLIFDKNGDVKFGIIPYEQCNSEPRIQIKKGKDIQVVEQKIQHLNEIIQDKEKLQEEYGKFLDTTSSGYDVVNIWGNKYLKALYRRGYLPSFISDASLRSIENKVQCESHRERFLHFLQKKLRR